MELSIAFDRLFHPLSIKRPLSGMEEIEEKIFCVLFSELTAELAKLISKSGKTLNVRIIGGLGDHINLHEEKALTVRLWRVVCAPCGIDDIF
jgi:hypothetical protein